MAWSRGKATSPRYEDSRTTYRKSAKALSVVSVWKTSTTLRSATRLRPTLLSGWLLQNCKKEQEAVTRRRLLLDGAPANWYASHGKSGGYDPGRSSSDRWL